VVHHRDLTGRSVDRTVESSVYLERTRGSRRTRERQDVISYPEGQGNTRPQVKWVSAKELVVAISAEAQAHLDLQVVTLADIQIKLEVLRGGISSSGSAAMGVFRTQDATRVLY
jgi:hypothetical protein